MLEVKGLCKRYGETLAVDDVSFTVQPGETFGLLGPNGAGKTTTISIAVGSLDADSGSATLFGQPVAASKHRIGYVPQDIALFGELSARRNLEFFGQLYGLGGSSLASAIDRALNSTGLADRADEPVKQYSGGMKRRANIAVAILHDPEFLIFDEPTVGVDPQSRNAIFSTLEQLAGQGKTLLYTTHYMEEVERLCDRVAIMDRGKIVADGPINELHKLLPVSDDAVIEFSGQGDLSSLVAMGCAISGQTLTKSMANIGSEMPDLLTAMGRLGLEIEAVRTARPSLEDVFLHLTGTALRD